MTMKTEQIDAIKQHVLKVVENSGISVPVTFTELGMNNSTGTFRGQDFAIEFCIERLELEWKRQESLGTRIPSLLHLADMIIAHELGHAKDQLLRDYVKEYSLIAENILAGVRFSDKKYLKHAIKRYATFDYQLEENAWDYSLDFVLLTHNVEGFQQYKEYCLNSYRSSYVHRFKMHTHTLHLMAQLKHVDHRFPELKYHFTIIDYGFSSYDKEAEQIKINVPHLLRRKPKKLNISRNRYVFYETLHMIAKARFVKNELVEEVGKVLFTIRKGKDDYTREDRKKLMDLSDKRRSEEREAFAFMEDILKDSMKDHTHSYLQYKHCKLLDVEDDLRENFEYIENWVQRCEKKKKTMDEKQTV